MPANLTPQYRKAEEAYRHARTVPEKIEALEEMLRQIPKHKGTEHIQGDIKRRIAKVRESGGQSSGKGGPDPFYIEKQGAGQIAVIGVPNAGKSALVGAVTKARVNIASFPFATHAPVTGMMRYRDVQIQLIDLPPFMPDGIVTGMTGCLRNADVLLICLDLSAADLLEQAETCFSLLAGRGIYRAGREIPEDGAAYRMLVVGAKTDLAGTEENLEVLRELRPDIDPVHLISTETGAGLPELAAACFDILDVVRVYTKQPGQKADLTDPFTLPRGNTVLDLARAVHRDLGQELKYARVWGSAKFDGQSVQQDHVLADGDVVELHT